LASAAAHHWRSVRARLILAGIPDPLRQLPDIHAILDVVEVMLMENQDKAQREKLLDGLYMPDLEDKPSGFEEEDTEDAFAAFAAVAGDFT
jgi:hypothetical protein